MRENQLIARSDAALEIDDGQRRRLAGRAEPCGTGLYDGRRGLKVGSGHFIHLDGRGLVLPGCSVRLLLTARRYWAVSNCIKRDLATQALKMAIVFRSPRKRCIFHSHRGSHYCSQDYQKILCQRGFRVSMSGKGNCYDNSAVGTFFETIKAELIWQ